MSRDDSVSNAESYNYKQLELAWDHRKIAIELRSKFEFYFTALTFTLLGLAIQTAQKGIFWYLNYVEICGWMVLLISGIIGLYSLSKFWQKELAVAEIKELSVSGSVGGQLRNDVNAIVRRIERWSKIKGILFLVGMVLLIISRSIKLVAF